MSGQGFCRPAPLKLLEAASDWDNATLQPLEFTTHEPTMSTGFAKRKRGDADEGERGHRHKQQKQFPRRPGPSKNQHTRRTKSESAKSADEEAQKSINALKSRVRDLSRLLRHADSDEKNRMPQGIRIERERELESCRHELEEKQTAQRESKFRSDIIGKYHMVRFFGKSLSHKNHRRLLRRNRTSKGNKDRQAPS